MSSSAPPPSEHHDPSQSTAVDRNGNPPTFAAFAPAVLGHYPSSVQDRPTILLRQKSPLLVTTPPQITRALAYSYPFLLPLTKALGLLTWTSDDPWESFLLLASFWAVTLYGDVLVRWAGPLVLVLMLIAGTYARRYSPLSSRSSAKKSGEGDQEKSGSDGSPRNHTTLEEMVDTLNLFTSRCSILLDPLFLLTDVLSTQKTATSSTTRPALTALLVRIVLVTPIWILLTLPPLYIITTRRVILTIGTIVLSWYSRPARVSRTILWRSRTVRQICAVLTGLPCEGTAPETSASQDAVAQAAGYAVRHRALNAPSIRFTFAVYENQRRWLGLGWTSSMLAYERAPWTDEHLNPSPPKEEFELPEAKGGNAKWRWVEGSDWRVEGAGEGKTEGGSVDDEGWVYYDNKWRDGRRGQDGWGRYTRRRKWCRDAELVEIDPASEPTPSTTTTTTTTTLETTESKENADAATSATASVAVEATPAPSATGADIDSPSRTRKRGWFRRDSKAHSERSAATGSSADALERDAVDDDLHHPVPDQEREHNWGLGDDARMELG